MGVWSLRCTATWRVDRHRASFSVLFISTHCGKNVRTSLRELCLCSSTQQHCYRCKLTSCLFFYVKLVPIHSGGFLSSWLSPWFMAVFLSEAAQTGRNKAKQSRTASCDLVGPLQPETHRYMTATYMVSVCIVPLYRVASTLRICVSKAFPISTSRSLVIDMEATVWPWWWGMAGNCMRLTLRQIAWRWVSQSQQRKLSIRAPEEEETYGGRWWWGWKSHLFSVHRFRVSVTEALNVHIVPID